MNLSEKIDNIELKIRQLALKVERLRNENIDLSKKNEQLKAELDKQQGAVSALKDKLTKTQGVLERREVNETEHTQQLRGQLDQYIKEIDKCIEWLQNS